MDFEFSADQEMLRDSVRRFLADKAPIAYVRDAYDHDGSELGRDDVWAGLRDIGAVGLLVPEEHGGAGMGMVDAAVVLEELGGAVPGAVRVVGNRRGVRWSSARVQRASTRSCCRAWPTEPPSERSRCTRSALGTSGARRRLPSSPTATCGG